MSKTYNRQFRKNGYSFRVENLPKADIKEQGDKYYLMVKVDGKYTICHDLYWNMPRFKTIREAHDWGFINTWICYTIKTF